MEVIVMETLQLIQMLGTFIIIDAFQIPSPLSNENKIKMIDVTHRDAGIVHGKTSRTRFWVGMPTTKQPPF